MHIFHGNWGKTKWYFSAPSLLGVIYPGDIPPNALGKFPDLTGECLHHQEGPWVPNMAQARWLARDYSETSSITVKPEAVSHMVE